MSYKKKFSWNTFVLVNSIYVSSLDAFAVTNSTLAQGISKKEEQEFVVSNDLVVNSATYGPLRSTDTLWSIANKYRTSKEVSVYQMMLAIYEKNIESFHGKNINNIIVGSIIDLPNTYEVSSINDDVARARFSNDNSKWARSSKQKSKALTSDNEIVFSQEEGMDSVTEKKRISVKDNKYNFNKLNESVMSVYPNLLTIELVSLQELADFVLVGNPRVVQSKERVEINRSLVDEARSAWLPQVSINADTNTNRGAVTNAYGISISQLLYDFGSTSYNVDAATYNYIASEHQQIVDALEILRQVTTYYLEIKRYEGLVTSVDEGLLNLKKIHDIALMRESAGLTSKSDSLQIITKMSSLRTLSSQYRSTLNSLKVRISALAGISAKNYKPFVFDDSELVAGEHFDISKIPMVRIAEANVIVAKSNVKRIERSGLPKLSLTLGKSRNFDEGHVGWDDQVNINLSYPLYQGGALNSQVKQARGGLSIAKRELQQIRIDVMQTLQVSFNDWTSSLRRKNESLVQYEAAIKAKDIYANEYILGKRSLNDLLSIEQDLIQSIQSKVNADADSQLAIVEYLSATGWLLKKIKDS